MSNVIPLYPAAPATRPPLLWRIVKALAVSAYMIARAPVLIIRDSVFAACGVVAWLFRAVWAATRIAVVTAAILLAFALTPPILWPVLFVLLLILQALKRGRA
jgi:hypothetical protein